MHKVVQLLTDNLCKLHDIKKKGGEGGVTHSCQNLILCKYSVFNIPESMSNSAERS
jgi:hypothetical protein